MIIIRVRTLLLTAGLLIASLGVLSPALAQDTTPSVRTPDNLETLLMILGFGVVVLVGFIFTVRATGVRDEEDEPAQK